MKHRDQMAASIGAAAGVLGCDLRELQLAKKAGCKAFRSNGSVNVTELTAWLKDRPKPAEGKATKLDLELRKLAAQCDGLEFKNEVSRGEYTSNPQIRADMLRLGTATRAAFQMLLADIPTWEGKTAAEMEKLARDRADKICATLHDQSSKLYG